MTGAARLTSAALALQRSDRATATAQYRQIIEDKSVPQTVRDTATIRLTQLEFDTLQAATGDRAPAAARGQGQRLVRHRPAN